jgi:N-methylhydantoinase A
MIRAIKAVSSERGRDPREYAFVVFGGNGPLFAVAMAQALSLGRVTANLEGQADLALTFSLLCLE